MKLAIIEQRRLWWTVSGVVIAAGLVAMAICFQQFGTPLKLGLDFVGGTRLQVELDCAGNANPPEVCDRPIEAADVRAVLDAQGFENAAIQLLDRDSQLRDRHIISIRTPDLDVEERTELVGALEAAIGTFDPEATQIDTVGPVLGQETLVSGLLAVIVALAGIVAYLSLRFRLDYALFAIVALLHDLLVTIGVFAGLGVFLGIEIDTLFVVALLTIIGFSVNDTVVIYDRIRENSKADPEAAIDTVVDRAVNQTLARSINTTLSTLLAVVAIFLFGGATLRYFSLALIVGFVSGSYSSIFIASTLLSEWRLRFGRSPEAEAIEDDDAAEEDSIGADEGARL